MTITNTPGLTLHGAGGLTGGHLPLPKGPQPIRPIQRRNTSPFTPQRRWYKDDETRRASEHAAAEALRKLDKRKRAGATGKGNNPAGRPATFDVEQAIRRYEAGETTGRDLGVPYKTIAGTLKRRGVTMRHVSDYQNGGQTTLFDHAAMIADAPTTTLRDLAKRYGVDPRTIRRHLSRAGVRCLDGRKIR